MHILWLTLSPVECMWVGAALGWMTCGVSVLILPFIWRTRDVNSLSKIEIITLLRECADELRARSPDTIRAFDKIVDELGADEVLRIHRSIYGEDVE